VQLAARTHPRQELATVLEFRMSNANASAHGAYETTCLSVSPNDPANRTISLVTQSLRRPHSKCIFLGHSGESFAIH
jgi:hypothetical protein